jgi:tetratricopeptide (TPR) repeat protein
LAVASLGAALAAGGEAWTQDPDPSDAPAEETREDRKRREQEERAREYLIRRETERARRQLASEGKLPAETAAAEAEEEEEGERRAVGEAAVEAPAAGSAAAAADTEPAEPAPAANDRAANPTATHVPVVVPRTPSPVAAAPAPTRSAAKPAPVAHTESPSPATNPEGLASPAEVASAGRDADAKKKRPAKNPSLPSGLARAQRSVRGAKLGQDPTVQVYLGMVDRQEASPHQLAALGSFLAQNGMFDEALAYYHVAIQIEEKDPLLWLNLGTLHRQRNELSAALSAYGEALRLDPNNALGHYNVGAILDSTGDYQGAIDQYKIALTLDPALGDPAVNPQAANNERLLAVKLLLYRENAGSLGLPLVEIPTAGADRNE